MPSILRRACSVAVLAVAVASVQPFVAGTASAATLGVPSGLQPDSTGLSPSSPAAVQKDPVLAWNGVGGASHYRVELSRSNDWTDTTVLIALPNSGVTTAPRLTLPQTLLHGDYFWRVRAENGTTVSAWSGDAEVYKGWFAAPTPGPAAGGDATVDWRTGGGLDTAPFRMSWTALPDASSYNLEVSTEPTFPQPGTVQSGKTIDSKTTVVCITTHTTFTPYGSVFGADSNVDDCDLSQLNNTGPLYWRVRGLDDSNSDVPTNNTSADSLQCFGAVNDPTTTETKQPSTASALGSPSLPTQECSRWSTPVQIPFPTGGDGAFDAANMTTGPTTTLSCPTVSGKYVCSDMPEIQWSPLPVSATFPQTYRVTIADDPDFTIVERTYDTAFLTLTPRDQLPDKTAGDGYYVAVQGCTAPAPGSTNPGCGPATVVSFTKVTPRVGGLSATPLPGGERFTWNDLMNSYTAALATHGLAAVEAVEYRLELARTTDPDFTSPVHVFTVDRACDLTSASTCYQPGVTSSPGAAQAVVKAADGTYLWRVVPVDVAGNHVGASTTHTVTLDTTAPAFHLTDPTTGHGLTAPFHITASESDVTGVNGSSLKLVPVVGGGGAVPGTLTGTAPHWTFTPSVRLVTGQRYGLAVTSAIRDAAGNFAVVTGSPVRTTRYADDKSVGWAYSGTWHRISASGAAGGTFMRGATGSSASLKFVGSSVAVYACKAPHLGKMTIQIDGVTKSAPALAQSFTSCNVLVYKTGTTATAVHTLRIVASGGPVDLDRAVVG